MSHCSLSLPPDCVLRRASAKDIWRIRKLVLSEKLDPTQLRWQQFWIIECEGQLVACGQLRNFAGVQELGSLVVVHAWRNQGLGSFLTRHLIEQATQPLYLECLGEWRVLFYTRLGFVPISWQELPPPLKWKFGLTQLAKTLLRIPAAIMHYQITSK